MTRALPPTRSEIEALERGLYGHGDITSVARLKGIDPSYLSKQLNPDEPDHKGTFYPHVLHLWYCDHSTDNVGDGYRELTETLRTGWRGTREPDKAEVVTLVRAVNDSMIDLLNAQILGLPYTERMIYVDKAMRLLDAHKRDMQLNDIEDAPVNIRGKRA